MRKTGQEITLSKVDEYIYAKGHNNYIPKQDIIYKVLFSENGMWFAGLIEMQNFSRSNKGFRYILLCIDVFTRK